MALSRNVILAAGIGAVVLAAAFALGFTSSGDERAPAGLSEAESPVITVYKSPT